MATKIGDAFVEIGADMGKLNADFGKAKAATTGFGTVFKGVFAGSLVAGAVQTATSYVKDFVSHLVSARMEASRAGAELAATFSAFGTGSPYDLGDLQNTVTLLESMGAQEGAAMMKTAAHLRMLGAGTGEIDDMMRAAYGLKMVLGTDLPTAAEMLNKAMEGNFMMLERQIPALRNVKTDQEKFAVVLESARKGIDVTGAGLDTFAGRWERFNRGWKEGNLSMMMAAFTTDSREAGETFKDFNLQLKAAPNDARRSKDEMKNMVQDVTKAYEIQKNADEQILAIEERLTEEKQQQNRITQGTGTAIHQAWADILSGGVTAEKRAKADREIQKIRDAADAQLRGEGADALAALGLSGTQIGEVQKAAGERAPGRGVTAKDILEKLAEIAKYTERTSAFGEA